MATLFNETKRKRWVLEWGWNLNGKRTKNKSTAKWKTPQDRKRAPAQLQHRLREVETVEHHIRTGIAPKGGPKEIDRWVTSKYLSAKTAVEVWSGYQPTVSTKANLVDWVKIKEAFEDHYLSPTRPGGKSRDPNRKSFKNHMSQYKYIESWLKDSHPTLTPSDEDLRVWQRSLLSKGESASTVNKRRNALAIVFKVAAKLEMVSRNPLKNPETAPIKTLTELQKKPRRPMDAKEAANSFARLDEKIDVYSSPYSLEGRKYAMTGCLPIAFCMGWYMGLRNEEVRWATWDSIDYSRGIYYVQETTCDLTGEHWTPKDSEFREIKIIDRMMERFKWEHERQKGLITYYTDEKNKSGDKSFSNRLPPNKKVGDIKNPSPLGQFIIPSGWVYRSDLHGRPIGETAFRRSFNEFILNESDLYRKPLPTFYSGRHTYATEAARAGMKPVDLKRAMGHADIRTTMRYIDAVSAEESTIEENLPY